jgi:hypothetical protein
MDPYFNNCRMLCIELPDDGPYVTETCSVWNYIFIVSTVFWLIILYSNVFICIRVESKSVKYIFIGEPG